MAISHCYAIGNALTDDRSAGYSGVKWQKVGQSGALASSAGAFEGGKKRARISAHFTCQGGTGGDG